MSARAARAGHTRAREDRGEQALDPDPGWEHTTRWQAKHIGSDLEAAPLPERALSVSRCRARLEIEASSERERAKVGQQSMED